MTQQHPISPPPGLIEKWIQVHTTKYDLARKAAQWGADQELEACCDWVKSKQTYWAHDELRAARRPKPLSLKEQAMRVFLEAGYTLGGRMELEPEDIDIIHRALEQLND
jgi:hypothetical protein